MAHLVASIPFPVGNRQIYRSSVLIVIILHIVQVFFFELLHVVQVCWSRSLEQLRNTGENFLHETWY